MDYENKYGFCEGITGIIRAKARQAVGKAGITVDDVPDIEQELATAVHLALPAYDPTKSKVTTFATRIVDRQISKILRHRKREKRDYRRETTHLNAPMGSDGDCASCIENFDEAESLHHSKASASDHEQEAALRLDVAAALERLPDDLKPIAECLRSENVAQAARTLGIPRSTLYGGIERIRLFFEGAGLKVYLT